MSKGGTLDRPASVPVDYVELVKTFLRDAFTAKKIMTREPRGDRIERAADNEALFREINERLQEMAQAFEGVANMAVFACECADLACVEQIQMSVDEYEAVRSDPNNFVVVPGHVDLDVENVIRDNERFAIVAKIGTGARIAAETDPRSE